MAEGASEVDRAEGEGEGVEGAMAEVLDGFGEGYALPNGDDAADGEYGYDDGQEYRPNQDALPTEVIVYVMEDVARKAFKEEEEVYHC